MLFDDKTQKNYFFYELKSIKTGDSFGQLALMENKPRSASIICKEDCHFAILDKEHFDGILSKLFIFYFSIHNKKKYIIMNF